MCVVRLFGATDLVLPHMAEAQATTRPPRARRAAAPSSTFSTESRRSTEVVAQAAKNAILCWHHPLVNRTTLTTKEAWAVEWGVTKQRFGLWERKLEEDGVLHTFRSGVLPVPSQPQSDGSMRTYELVAIAHEVGTEPEPNSTPKVMYGLVVPDLRAALLEKCTRHGGQIPYGTHGPCGLYREA